MIYRIDSLEEAHRLGHEMPLMWFWRFLTMLSPADRREAYRRISGYVLLERVD